MQELFTRGLPGRHKKFKKTEVGYIPEDWGLQSIDNLKIKMIDGDRGKNYPKENELLDEGCCVFLTNKNIVNGDFNFSLVKFISKELDKRLRAGKLQVGDIVLTTRGSVGNLTIFSDEVPFQSVRINSCMLILRNYEANFHSGFLLNVLKKCFECNFMSNLASGSAQPQLPVSSLRHLKLIKPSMEEQKVIFGTIETVESYVRIYRIQLDKLIYSKSALMQVLLTGEVRVKGV